MSNATPKRPIPKVTISEGFMYFLSVVPTAVVLVSAIKIPHFVKYSKKLYHFYINFTIDL